MNLVNLPTLTPEIEIFMCESLREANELFKQEVESGVSQLWEVNSGETYFITRTERDSDGKRILVVCCFEGREIFKVYDLIEKSCIKLGYVGVRYHTHRKGMLRFGKMRGFKIIESRPNENVLYKSLMH